MMPVLSIKQFLNDMRRQKLRTFMTMFGIFWGTCSIILLFAFGQGLKEKQLESMAGLGENIAIFWPGLTSKEWKGLPRGRQISFTEEDISVIKQRAQTISRISPEYSKWSTPVKVGKNASLRNVIGIWPEFGEMRNVIPDVGSRFINDRDIAERRRVVFLGDRLKTDLFGPANAIGEQILINGTPFTVIGVMKTKDQDSSYNGRDSGKAFVPSSTFSAMFTSRYLNDFVVQCKTEYTMNQSRAEILEILGGRYKFDPTDREALSVWDTTEEMAWIKNFFSAFQMFLTGMGIATLITGGIGVSNIMNVVLEERTKEIGIKMALGASKATIMSQFIFETFLITAIGGLFGFLAAWGIVSVASNIASLADSIGIPVINITGAILAVVLLGIVGFVAGIFPARRASNLQPVQALKLF